MCYKELETILVELYLYQVGIEVQNCEAIGSSKTSQHAKGQAADFEIHGISNAELCKWISEHCDWDQMILEFHNIDEPNSGWVHCSYRSDGENRKQILRAYKNE